MGLLLSVLVACVGVVELLAFYSTVSRNFVTVYAQTNLSDFSKRYLENLEQHRKYLQSQITITNDKNDVESSVQVSSDNIEVEFLNPASSKSRSPSPRTFLSTEKESTDRSISPSPHHFIATNTNVGDKNKDLPTVPTSLAEEGNKKSEESIEKHFKVENEDDKTLSPFPLPKQFIVIEQESLVTEKENSVEGSLVTESAEKSRAVCEEDLAFRRSPSPYPSLALPVPRNSICGELIDNSVSVVEVDEELISRSPTPEKIHATLQSKHNTTEYWTNKILVVPSNKRRSSSPAECSKSQKSELFSSEKSKSLTDTNNCENKQNEFTLDSILSKDSEVANNDNENEDEIKSYDEQFLDSLDGVKKKKMFRNSASRRSRKKKSPSVSFDNESKAHF